MHSCNRVIQAIKNYNFETQNNIEWSQYIMKEHSTISHNPSFIKDIVGYVYSWGKT